MFILSVVSFLLLSSHVYASQPCDPSKTLSKNDLPYTYGGSAANPTKFDGVFDCSWIINVDPGYYVVMTTTSQLSTSEKVSIVYPGNTISDYLPEGNSNDVFYLPAGQSNVSLEALLEGNLYMSFTLGQLTDARPVITVGITKLLLPYSLNLLANSVFTFNTTGNQMITIGSDYLKDTSNNKNINPLKSCLIYNRDQLTGTFVNIISNTITSTKNFKSPLTIYCVVNPDYDGIFAAQIASNTQDLAVYKIAVLKPPAGTSLYRIASQGNVATGVTFISRKEDTFIEVTNVTMSLMDTQAKLIDGPPGQGPNSVVNTFNHVPFIVDGKQATVEVQYGTIFVTVCARDDIYFPVDGSSRLPIGSQTTVNPELTTKLIYRNFSIACLITGLLALIY